MKPLWIVFASMIMSIAPASAADQTWSGKISDSMCGAKHDSSAQHGKKLPDRDCALACLKDHNANLVFVSGGKVYNFSNPDFAAVREHAGHTVKVTGVMKGDSITVSKIAMQGK